MRRQLTGPELVAISRIIRAKQRQMLVAGYMRFMFWFGLALLIFSF